MCWGSSSHCSALTNKKNGSGSGALNWSQNRIHSRILINSIRFFTRLRIWQNRIQIRIGSRLRIRSGSITDN